MLIWWYCGFECFGFVVFVVYYDDCFAGCCFELGFDLLFCLFARISAFVSGYVWTICLIVGV